MTLTLLTISLTRNKEPTTPSNIKGLIDIVVKTKVLVKVLERRGVDLLLR